MSSWGGVRRPTEICHGQHDGDPPGAGVGKLGAPQLAPALAPPPLGRSWAARLPHAPALVGVTDGGVVGAAEPALMGGLARAADGGELLGVGGGTSGIRPAGDGGELLGVGDGRISCTPGTAPPTRDAASTDPACSTRRRLRPRACPEAGAALLSASPPCISCCGGLEGGGLEGRGMERQ
jgi:hypothetical protein